MLSHRSHDLLYQATVRMHMHVRMICITHEKCSQAQNLAPRCYAQFLKRHCFQYSSLWNSIHSSINRWIHIVVKKTTHWGISEQPRKCLTWDTSLLHNNYWSATSNTTQQPPWLKLVFKNMHNFFKAMEVHNIFGEFLTKLIWYLINKRCDPKASHSSFKTQNILSSSCHNNLSSSGKKFVLKLNKAFSFADEHWGKALLLRGK